jgi:hypothetical protein
VTAVGSPAQRIDGAFPYPTRSKTGDPECTDVLAFVQSTKADIVEA